MAYTRSPGKTSINNWFHFPKQFLKPYGVIERPVGMNDYWTKIDSSNSELHHRPNIGLSETAESIGENAQLIKDKLSNIDLEEICHELDGLQQTFHPLNNRNKVPIDRKDVKEMCRRVVDADTDIWDQMELLGKQMYICAIHHKNLWMSLDDPKQYAQKLKTDDPKERAFKDKPDGKGLLTYWTDVVAGQRAGQTSSRQKISQSKKRKMFESDEEDEDSDSTERKSHRKRNKAKRHLGSAFEEADKPRKHSKRKQVSFSDSSDSESQSNRPGTSGISHQQLDEVEATKRNASTIDTVTEDVPVTRRKGKKAKKQTPEKAPEA